MIKQTVRNTFFAVTLALGAATAGYAAEPTLHQVFEAVQAGKLAEADTMINEVMKTHPDSAKAHFVHAEVLAREGRRDEARTALATAERLSPGLSFVKPAAVTHLNELIDGRASALPAAAGTASSRRSSLAPILLGVGGLLVVMFIVRAMSARRNSSSGYYPSSYPGAQGTPMGPGPMGGMGGMGGSGPGIGSSLASGLAIGAGVAAGEALVHRVLDGSRTDSFVEPGAFSSAGRSVPEDQDFGVSDGSSWGDSSNIVDNSDLGGDDIGGDDWS